jgi:capsid protein
MRAIRREAQLLRRLGPTPADFYHEWIWPALPEGDAKTGAQAATFAIDNRTMSRNEVINMRGRDPVDVFRELAAEEAMLREMGVDMNTGPTQFQQPQEANEDD